MKRAMVDRKARRLSVTRQCRVLSLPRSSLYYQRKGESVYNLELMTLIDKQFMDTPFYGVRQMTWHLKGEGHTVNKKRIRRLMRLMGLMPIYQKPNTSKPNKAHKTYPYLLGGVKITQANHVWCADITYIPMRKGFLYLVAIMDWATRRVLSWRLSNTQDADFCVEALNEAILRFGPPKIFNSDQGSQFTSFKWTDTLRKAGVKISMDGKGRFMDNIFIERLWRSLKYECVYLHAWSGGREAKAGIGKWIEFYNHNRPHTVHNGLTPNVAYWTNKHQQETDQMAQRVA
jgi:putative transposase